MQSASTLDDAVASTPMVIRSLRRRLWKAFRQEDVVTALRAYKATRLDWEHWVQEEAKEARRLEDEKRKQRPTIMKFFKGSPSSNNKRQTVLSSSNTIMGSFSPESIQTAKSHDDAATVSLLQLYMNPSDPFTYDDFKDPNDPYDDDDDEDEKVHPIQSSKSKQHHRRRSSNNNNKAPQARFAFSFLGRSRESRLDSMLQQEPDPNLDMRMTTPMHEAARLGNGELVRLMLERSSSVEPNFRNGSGRTILHMVSGGVTKPEMSRIEDLITADDGEEKLSNTTTIPIGIRAPLAIQPDSSCCDGPDHLAARSAKKAARAVSRIFRDKGSNHDSTIRPNKDLISEQEWNQLIMDRTDATLAILSWTHPQDGTERSGESISINAVDRRGRTALHYAAELGRSDICMSISSNFGSMLTIVDDQARTPCELAADGKHDDLAAQLEARALLYIDPYGMDEELLASVSTGEGVPEKGNVLPFSWFQTLNVNQVQDERERRLKEALEKMLKIIEMKLNNESSKKMQKEVIDTEVAGSSHGVDQSPSTVASSNGQPKADDSPASAGVNGDNAEDFMNGNPNTELLAFRSLNKSYAELYLTYHAWDVRKSLLAFLECPAKAFREANVPVPCPLTKGLKSEEGSQQVCLICCEVFDAKSKKLRKLGGCEHSFCAECLGDYLANCASTKSTGVAVICPHHECDKPLLPLEVVNLAATSEIYGSLLNTANENFVVSAKDIRFCPHPGCSGIAKFNAPAYFKTAGIDSDLLEIVGAVCTAVTDVRLSVDEDNITYDGVCDPNYYDCRSSIQPKSAHRFCFVCGENGLHWPVTCERLEEWQRTVQEEIREVQDDTEGSGDYNDISHRLWMKTNTRPCPKCKAPIEKNEGCNHMTCSNPSCKHEFCWICRNDWKLHNTETGGFFRCNRWVEQKEHDFYDTPPQSQDNQKPSNEDLSDPRTMEATYGTAMHHTRVSMKRSREMARFLHHYQRWNAHADSAALERKMGESVCQRLEPVVNAAIEFTCDPVFNFGGKGLSFVHAAFTELLECRSMLQHSYAFSYFRYAATPWGHKEFKRYRAELQAFEQLQSELEMMTEQMSDVVARSHLRATQAQITFLTAAASGKRKEFSNLMMSILMEERKEARRAYKEPSRLETSTRNEKGRGPITLADILDGSGADEDDDEYASSIPSSQEPVSSENQSTEELEEALRASLQEFNSSAQGVDGVAVDDREDVGDWSCPACTYVNSSGRRCDLCGTRR